MLQNGSMPIFHLPPEILAEIFIQLHMGPISIPFPDYQLLTLTQVCGYWRAVISSMSSIWAQINIKFSDHLLIEQLIEIVQWCVIRSGECLIDLDIDFQPPHPRCVDLATMSDVVVQRLIGPNACRWRKLDLLLAPQSFDILLNLPSASFSKLEDITVVINAVDHKRPVCVDLSTGLAMSPRLSRVTLLNQGRHLEIWNLACPWNQLTELNLSETRLFVESCYAVLRQCNLLRAFATQISAYTELPDVSQPIILPHLHSLAILPSSRTRDFSTFFTPFVTPNLKQFHFECARMFALSTVGFQAFHARSRFRLEHLQLQMRPSDRDVFLDILNCCPSLTKLHIPSSSFLLGAVSIIPRLEHLIISGGWDYGSHLHTILDVRTRPGVRFPLKCLEFLHVPQEKLRLHLEEFVVRGLEVRGAEFY